MMKSRPSLAERLEVAPHTNTGGRPCATCEFYRVLPPKDQAAFDNWISEGRSLSILHGLCVEDGLNVKIDAFRKHIRERHAVTR